MKTSWIIGIVTLYLIIFAVEMMVTKGTAFSSGVNGQLNSMMGISMANYSNSNTAFVSLIINAGTYIMTFINVVFLWSPTVFAGYGIWFWQFICLPVSIGTVISMVQVIRGVRSG